MSSKLHKFIRYGFKSVLVALFALALTHCDNDNDSPAPAPHPLVGSWIEECSPFSNGSERQTFTFNSAASLTVLLEAYNLAMSMPAAADCSGDPEIEVTSEYNIALDSSEIALMLTGMNARTVNGFEIDYTLTGMSAIPRTPAGVTLVNTNLGVSGAMQNQSVDLPLSNTLARPNMGGQYRGVYYIDISPNPRQLYVRIGEDANPAPDARITSFDSDNVYERE